jgi:hypothetical protein
MKRFQFITEKACFLLLALSALVLTSCGKEKNQSEKQNETSRTEGTSHNRMGGSMMEGVHMMQGEGMMSEEMHQAMMSGKMGPGMMEDMRSIRQLLLKHDKISRRVENLPNGVKTRTTSDDPQLASLIQKHVRQMKERMEEKKPIRQMDPLFRELFDQADKVKIDFEDIENGIVVVETSDDPQIVKLIQQHANKAVSEFVQQGMSRAMQPTPLPDGYKK